MADITFRPPERTNAQQQFESLGDALQNILGGKIQGMQQGQTAQGIMSLLPGIDSKSAWAIASNPNLMQYGLPKAMEGLQQQQKQRSIQDILNRNVGGGTQMGGGKASTSDRDAIEQQYREEMQNAYAMMEANPNLGSAMMQNATSNHNAALDRLLRTEEFSEKQNENIIRHQEVELTRDEKIAQQKEMNRLKLQAQIDSENAKPAAKNLEEATLNKPIVATIDNIVRMLDSGAKTGSYAQYSPDVVLKTLGDDATLEVRKELKRLVAELVGKTKGPMTKAKIQLTNEEKPILLQDPAEIKRLLYEVRDEVNEPVRKQQIADEMILENDKLQPRGLWTMVNKTYEEEQAIEKTIESIEAMGLDINTIPNGTVKPAPRSNILVVRDTSAPRGFSIKRRGNAKK